MSWGLGPCHSLPRRESQRGLVPPPRPPLCPSLPHHTFPWGVWPKQPWFGKLGRSERTGAGRGLRQVGMGENGVRAPFRSGASLGVAPRLRGLCTQAEEAAKAISFHSKARSMGQSFHTTFKVLALTKSIKTRLGGCPEPHPFSLISLPTTSVPQST